MNMHALCSAFRGVRVGDVLSHIHRYVEGKATRGEGWERGNERERERKRDCARDEQRDRGGGWRR